MGISLVTVDIIVGSLLVWEPLLCSAYPSIVRFFENFDNTLPLFDSRTYLSNYTFNTSRDALRRMEQKDTENQISEAGLQRTKSNRIRWNKQDKEYPRNWPTRRKVFDTSIIVFLEFYTYVKPVEDTGTLKHFRTDKLGKRTVISTTGVSLRYS